MMHLFSALKCVPSIPSFVIPFVIPFSFAVVPTAGTQQNTSSTACYETARLNPVTLWCLWLAHQAISCLIISMATTSVGVSTCSNPNGSSTPPRYGYSTS